MTTLGLLIIAVAVAVPLLMIYTDGRIKATKEILRAAIKAELAIHELNHHPK